MPRVHGGMLGPMKTRLRRLLYWFIGGLVVAFVLLCLPFNPPKWTAGEISERMA